MVSDAKTKAANAELSSQHVDQGFNVFRHIPIIVGDLPKLDLLHKMLIGMLNQFQKWVFHIMKMHERLDN
jgi:hypothetical protein